MLTTSVAVVRKMLDAVAGSAPKRFSVSGMIAPEMPLAMHEPIMARNTTKAEHHRLRLVLAGGGDVHADRGGDADADAVQAAEPGFLHDQRAARCRA